MTALTQKDQQTLLQDQTAIMQGRSTTPLDFSEGSVLRAFIESNSGIGLWLQAELLKVLAATRASTSVGPDLDSWVEDYGLQRLGSQTATGIVTFSRFTSSVQAVIPVGTSVQTSDGTTDFVVIADYSNSNFNVGLNGYVLAAGIASIDVPVAASVPGAGGNVAAGTITFITTQLNYVDQVLNAAAVAGGSEAETDANLRTRFIKYIQSLSRGTLPAIEFAAQSVGLGMQAKAQENVNADGTPNDGFVCVTVAMSGADPIVPDDLFSKAKAAVDAYRAGGIWADVFQPVVLYTSITCDLTFDPSYDPDIINEIIGKVGLTIEGYVNGLKLGQSLPLSKIANLAYGVSEGIWNVDNIWINDNRLDYPATQRNVIRAQQVVVNQSGTIVYDQEGDNL